jgi:lipoprotein-anchoring transpeptidase ErfK/SrfK
MFRLIEDVHTKTLVLPITSSHKLEADLHPKFIEVNKSNQRAYFFENGKLVKELVISTGVTWETPTGSFKVLNKVPMTISYSRIWYMPWYLPIGTINGPYYFGFHEIPYQVSYNGMIYSRDPETIGSPATGGCIQILKGQAKEVYDWAEVGTPVYITEN